jgi:hypothetical protein
MKREEEAIKETNESVGCESRDKVYPNSDNGGAAALKGGCGRKNRLAGLAFFQQ